MSSVERLKNSNCFNCDIWLNGVPSLTSEGRCRILEKTKCGVDRFPTYSYTEDCSIHSEINSPSQRRRRTPYNSKREMRNPLFSESRRIRTFYARYVSSPSLYPTLGLCSPACNILSCRGQRFQYSIGGTIFYRATVSESVSPR